MDLDYLFDFPKFHPGELVILRKFNLGFKPVLGFPSPGHDVDVHPRRFPREEEETIAPLPENCRAHGRVDLWDVMPEVYRSRLDGGIDKVATGQAMA